MFETIEVFKMLLDPTKPHGRLQDVRVSFVPPSLQIEAISDDFAGLDEEARLRLLQEWTTEVAGGAEDSLTDLMVRLPVSINAVTVAEASAQARSGLRQSGASWVSSFIDEPTRGRGAKVEATQKYVHFYGYKGGQGRSTVLGLLAKALADDGYRVLTVDADIEAPSLDLLFGVTADTYSQTLMGLCGWADQIQPVAGAYAGRFGGRVDLLPCRPRNDSADLDFALLVASAPLDSRVYEWAADRLSMELSKQESAYDVVLVDHRTGIASSVLPLMSRLPGSATVFARTDFNTAKVPSEMRRVVRSIFSATASVPGAFVGFQLDPNRKAGSAQPPAEARVREQLLNELACAMEGAIEGEAETEISVSELALNWIDWYLDRALLEPNLPSVHKLQTDNIASLGLLRETLGLPIGKRADRQISSASAAPSAATATSSLSGARDAGQFIHIPEVESLFVPGSPYSYVLGRKGTGKTRLLREMAARGLGTPLLVAADETGTSGLRSLSIEASEWLERCRFDASTFWWSLLGMAVEQFGSGAPLEDIVRRHVGARTEPKVVADRVAIKTRLMELAQPETLLIDGLETLVPAANIKEFVAALFNMMSAIQNDPALASRVTIRSFVREDLATDSVQNVEQQMEQRHQRLKWSARSILNFAISRLPTLTWIKGRFPTVCDEIVQRRDEVGRGAMSEQEATALMLRVFPARLRRNNLSTATFLRLYFSDAGGDDTNKATFYPRLYLSFLQKLDELASQTDGAVDDQEQRIASALLNRAYDEASSEFINETKQELSHLLSLEYEDENDAGRAESDQIKVTKFIAAFDGLSTPFEHEALIAQLQSRTQFREKSVRESLQRMKAIRMFEDRPGYGGWWRVGQLYKMGLRMKYVRG
ncbi:AAA family ATPase [Variovorax beijingensis]|uniref:AAA family ATPase n=1 Tax=Variovorax beijingensis TaxID=2496117 RepID=UPI00163A3C71|nr:AAA family ATPase [Variovorax beijingensis]